MQKVESSLKSWHHNINEIENFLRESKAQVVRFLFTDAEGTLKSITVPTSKINSADNESLIQALQVHFQENVINFIEYDKNTSIKLISNNTEQVLLYPDFFTGFYDPCSVQETYCLFCSLVSNETFEAQDSRSILYNLNENIEINACLNFTFENFEDLREIDSLYDIRSEICLEAIKAGININSHYTNDNKICTIVFSATNLLLFADSFQKLKMLVINISAAYGKFISKTENSLVFTIKNGKLLKKLFDKAFHNNYANNVSTKVSLRNININPYTLVKNLFL
jgi:glutamine synthetase